LTETLTLLLPRAVGLGVALAKGELTAYALIYYILSFAVGGFLARGLLARHRTQHGSGL